MSARNLCGLICLFIFSAQISAQSLPFKNLTSDDLNKIIGDMGTNFLHTSVSGAGTLGSIFGFEVGVVGGRTSTPHLNDVVNSQPGVTGDASKLPDAAILGVLTVPLGITVEAGFVPSVGGSGFQYNALSAAVKWTPTEILWSDLPLSLAVKGSYTTNTIKFHEDISGTPVDFKYSNAETAMQLLVSKNLAIFEPYAGFGLVSAKGTLDATSNQVFSPTLTTTNSASATRSGTMFMVGTEIKLLVVKLGAEYSNSFGTSRIMGKLSFYF